MYFSRFLEVFFYKTYNYQNVFTNLLFSMPPLDVTLASALILLIIYLMRYQISLHLRSGQHQGMQGSQMMLPVTASKPRMQLSAPYADHVSQPLELPKFKFRVLGQKRELDIIHSTMFAITNILNLTLRTLSVQIQLRWINLLTVKKVVSN